MRSVLAWILALVIPACARAQTQLVSEHYFPAEHEFRELTAVRSDFASADAARIGVPESRLFAEAGFRRYQKRAYQVDPAGTLTVEVVGLRDAKAAYSLLTLLGDGQLGQGPPGDFRVATPKALLFCQSSFFVRIVSDQESDLVRRVGVSVGNRIGMRERAPNLVARFPALGLQSGSIRYFLGPESRARYAYSESARRIELPPDVELAQARYTLAQTSGTLALVSFPTSMLAQDYYERVFERAGGERWVDKPGVYFKRSGPLIGVLEGGFAPVDAERVLGSVEFTYSVQWIYDKRNSGPRTVWGIPVGILGTVVRSLMFTGLLCVVSALTGLAIAVTRVLMRRFAPGNVLDRPERTEIIRLKLNEN
jgi:uncharacterized protein DUF6599